MQFETAQGIKRISGESLDAYNALSPQDRLIWETKLYEKYGRPESKEKVQLGPTAASPSALDQLKRGVQLAGRYAIEGPSDLIGLVAEPANVTYNLAADRLGLPKVAPYGQTVKGLLKDVGFPEPETVLENVVASGSRALTGAGSAAIGRLGKDVAKAVPQLLGRNQTRGQQVRTLLADKPVDQATSSMAADLAIQAAPLVGITNPVAQTAVGLAAGGALPTTTQTTQAVTGTTKRLADTIAKPEQTSQEIVGNLLLQKATNPEQAMRQLRQAEEIVPGSRPTVSQVSRDPGLISLETPLRASALDERQRLSERKAEQNYARQLYLDELENTNRFRNEANFLEQAGEPALNRAVDKRDRTYAEMVAKEFETKNQIDNKNIDKILDTIATVQKQPINASKDAQSALKFAKKLLTKVSDNQAPITNPRALYSIRQDLDQIRQGKVSSSDPKRYLMQRAGAVLNEPIKEIDRAIATQVPSYLDYLRVFSRRSTPVSQLEAITDLRAKADSTVVDPVFNVSDIKADTFIKQFKKELPKLKDTGPKGKQLTNAQIKRLNNVANDLSRGNAATARTMNVPGSNTMSNLVYRML